MSLVITTLPRRKGWWLGLVVDNTVQPLAKFRNDLAVDAFETWIKETPGLRCEDLTGFFEGPVCRVKEEGA